METRLANLKSSPLWWYCAVSFLVLAPFLKSGYILTLDMVFTPKLPWPQSATNLVPYQALLHCLNYVLPAQLLEKLIIFGILLLCGVGMHRLVAIKSLAPRYLAGIFYMVNPFTYERWMAGQYLIIAGYALLPFVIRAVLNYSRQPSKRSSGFVIGWLTLIALLSVHMLVLAVLLLLLVTLLRLLRPLPLAHYRRQLLLAGLYVAFIFCLLNLFWLQPVLRGSSPIATTIAGVGNTDLLSFATASGHHGLFLNVLSGYGFWLERYNRYAQPTVIVWILGVVLLGTLVALGIRRQYKARSALGLSLAAAAGVGFVMALGIHMPLSGPLVKAAILHVPFMRGFREPEKFSALLMLGYAYFMAHGLEYLLQRWQKRGELARDGLRYGALLLPLLYTATMPFGFAGQLRPVQYPASWYNFNKQLAYHPATGKVLFLPWHEYMSYDFSRRIIANPAPDFFAPAQVIAGTDAEFGGIVDPKPTSTSTFIESQFLDRTNRTDLGSVLAKKQIEYVLLSNGYGYQDYGYLARQKDLQLVTDQPGLTIYKNEAYHD